ncbi:Condensin-2 complex subunit D3 [Desmophyllum pertusum]|uniref:Condensin-2 complex subunit D3 n=1 Tax=Desmophyllum pertusum TaxID=174260 RepID=A0A9X0A2F4_9CNID|nr:Condensin-2 complex subunit D3 [Desmophyllum pertusum]
MDPALSVRRQAMVSLTSLLQERPACTMVHSLWLDGVLPLVMDRETTAQEKCFQILEDVLLSNIVPHSKSAGQHHILAWNLLDRVASPSGQEIRRYLHYAFQHWSKQNRLSGNLIKSLMSHIDNEHNKAAWLCLAEIGSSSNKLDHSFCCEKLERLFTRTKRYILYIVWHLPHFFTHSITNITLRTLCRILAVLGSTAPLLPSAVVSTLIADLQQKLITFDCPPEVIAAIVATLCKGNSNHWCSDLLKASEEFLSSVTLKQDSIDEELLTRTFVYCCLHQNQDYRAAVYVCGIHADISQTTNKNIVLMNSSSVTYRVNNPLQKLNLSPPVKAHAFVTLGKLCLQNEDLAKQCIAALARELETSDDPAIRNNVAVVMCDLCVRHCILVRRQTLTLLTHLLQEDFVKWKGALFYRFITTLVDEDLR